MKAKGGKKQQQQQQQQGGASHQPKTSEQVPTLQSSTLQQSLHILDRMVNQNMYEEIAMDFKYWDDASDAFRYGVRTLASRMLAALHHAASAHNLSLWF